MFHKAQGN